MAIDTGVAGFSIEDSTYDEKKPLRDIDDAVKRIRAARSAIDESRTGTLLVGRAENFIANRPDLDDTIKRLKAYSEAGANCHYAPGIKTREELTAIVAAVAPEPVNL
jgi:2-methylisocitrate lyase-like PEP mutase family enzyme